MDESAIAGLEAQDASAIEAIYALVEEMLWAGVIGSDEASNRIRAALNGLVGPERTSALFEQYVEV